jgi:ABC-type transport system involved in Fe-S cluster assembly fused permease/ATPase subunit
LKLSSNSNHIQGLVDAEKLLRLLEEQKEIVDKPDAKDLVLTDGVIEFRNVEFSYDGKVQAVDGISFTIEKGQSVALVGSSGSWAITPNQILVMKLTLSYRTRGKSSLLRLLYRFYEVTSGEILIDGQNIQDVTQRSLRSAIGIVPQDCTLWNDSIGKHESSLIVYGIAWPTPTILQNSTLATGKKAHRRRRSEKQPKPLALMSGSMGSRMVSRKGFFLQNVVSLCWPATCYDDITGYKTVVGERGVRLSGGEKQRVSLARTILKAPSILVLDEVSVAANRQGEID